MRYRFGLLALAATLLVTVAPAPELGATAPCTVETFEALGLPDTTITLTTVVSQTESLPEYCQVRGVVAPAITFEVRMPTSNWKGKYQGVGNGGLAGVISTEAMEDALRRNYATASTDTGHVAGDLGWFTNAQQLKDYGYRSIHEMTLKAKAIITAFYDVVPQYSYFVGCSTGGRQAFMEAQRYPDDYDGIIAGAPVYRVIQLRARHVWTWQATHNDPDSTIPFSKLPVLYNAVVASCDARDGLVDGLVSDPRRCKFDPSSLLCKGADDGACLTAAQVEAVRKIYAGPVNPRTGEQVYPGVPMTSELDWAESIGPVPNPSYVPFFNFTVFEDPDFDYKTFSFDTDVAYALSKEFGGETLEFIHNAEDPNLSDFKAHGGKMIIWHGWSDPLPTPVDTIRYYKNVVATLGRDHGHGRGHGHAHETGEFLRLFLLPNVGHCGGSSAGGPNKFDALTALEQWVEQDIAPQKIIASHVTDGVVDRTRPLCPYPQEATYIGHGSIDDAANFVCRVRHHHRQRDRDDDGDDR
jgi:feruloyl esterase